VALKAYFDESGTHWGGPNAANVFVLCGYIAPADVWDGGFEKKWSAMLEKPAITPKLEFFHAEDVEGRGSKRFRRLKQRERDDLKTTALNIVVNSGMLGVGVGVELDAFRRLVVNDPAVAAVVPANPYMFAFNAVLVETVLMADAFIGESNESIGFVFEDHPQWSVHALSMYNDIKKDPEWPKERRRRLGTPAFDCKEKFKALQAADHLAYETWRYMENKRAKKNATLRPAMNRFLSWQQHHGRYFDEHGILEFLRILREDGKL